MKSVLIRDVPDEAHAALVARAAAAGTSLQQFLLNELVRLAVTPSLQDVLARVEQHASADVSFEDAVSAIHRARDAGDE